MGPKLPEPQPIEPPTEHPGGSGGDVAIPEPPPEPDNPPV